MHVWSAVTISHKLPQYKILFITPGAVPTNVEESGAELSDV